NGEYRYYILNDDEINCGGLQTWLLNTISVSNILAGNRKLKDRIILENIPSGRKFLSVILDAMRENKVITILYQSYWKEDSAFFELEPYCIKLFKQRWYLAARSLQNSKVMIFALDRIANLDVMDEKTFIYPKNFSAEELFLGCYGVIADCNVKLETVKLQVCGNQSKYFRSLPLHDSQKEVFVSEEYSIFEYNIRPTFDFQQELLSFTPYVEVLSPTWLRNEIAWKVEAMSKRYN
ncbi:MAG: WYL domain-containing protein, partial [Muribaculaceae bacterium]|nr:WYL domain-containing protein [Muribaculaceae bacterium]